MANVKAKVVRNTEKAPPIYQEYIKKETAWIKNKVKHVKSLIDVGCGEGRATHFLVKLTDRYVGVDLDSNAISQAKKLENDKISFEVLDTANLSKHFGVNSFQVSVCLWNTIGNIKEDAKAIEEMYEITSDRCFITGLKKGNLEARKDYYNSYGIKFQVDENEVFRSDAWGVSRSYDKEDFAKMCKKVGFEVIDVVDLGKMGFGVELKK